MEGILVNADGKKGHFDNSSVNIRVSYCFYEKQVHSLQHIDIAHYNDNGSIFRKSS